MPQVGIGFLPDIGGTYFLPRMLGWTGLYLALTGRIIGPAEAYRHRLVSHCIPSAHFHVIKDALRRQPSDRPAARRAASRPGRGRARARIRRSSTAPSRAPSVEAILERLDHEQGDDASLRAARPRPRSARSRRPRSKSPSPSCKRGKSLDLAEALKLEFRLASHLVGSHDYREGIAARIAGKGRAPSWQPATLDDVDDAGHRAPVHHPGRGRA